MVQTRERSAFRFVREKDDTTDGTHRRIHGTSPPAVGESTAMGAEEDSGECFLRPMSRLCTNRPRDRRNERQRPDSAREMSALRKRRLSGG